MLPWEIPADYFLWKRSKVMCFYYFFVCFLISNFKKSQPKQPLISLPLRCSGWSTSYTRQHVLPAGEMRRWPCNWPWLSITTRSNAVTMRNIFLWWQGHNTQALSYSFHMVMEQWHNARPWWLARPPTELKQIWHIAHTYTRSCCILS